MSNTAGTGSGRLAAERPVAPALMREIVPCSAHDFERRWQRRLNTPPRGLTNYAPQFHVEVTHRFPAPNAVGCIRVAEIGLPHHIQSNGCRAQMAYLVNLFKAAFRRVGSTRVRMTG